ncbi:hypothetical protein THAOC_01803 [Thalassiosira oceanica]|uniref:B30.2/SPRY domain-containing protein n=1 Tax=Thalassiosira oceanica TaxID=159749 RepID=K0TGA9_THAOC|nr:hypothetical protein THAOC_01803 [Thalassiosira oceanica]|eukprot:EJK76435.1 hypothetical protein THAOC_01803 [Thalassiosira oceanica]
MEPRNKRARLPSATLDGLGNDLLVRCASYLDADGLAQLGRTSARFGIPQAGQQRSLANEAARQRFRQGATEDEGSRLPKYGDESDVGLLRALEQLRQPLCFDELVGNGFSPQEHPASVTCTAYFAWSTAVSGHVMRGGRHFVEFAIKNDRQSSHVHLGVIRPVSLTDDIFVEADWKGNVIPVLFRSNCRLAVAEKLRSQRTAKWGDSNVHCCAYYCYSGRCYWTDWDNEDDNSNWQGQERLQVSSTIGLLLDLDEGTLSVFRNGRRLGAMKEGLAPNYRPVPRTKVAPDAKLQLQTLALFLGLERPLSSGEKGVPTGRPRLPPRPGSARPVVLRRFRLRLLCHRPLPALSWGISCRGGEGMAPATGGMTRLDLPPSHRFASPPSLPQAISALQLPSPHSSRSFLATSLLIVASPAAGRKPSVEGVLAVRNPTPSIVP